MSFIEDMCEVVTRLAVFSELDVEAAMLPSSALRLSDAAVRDLLSETTALIKQASTLQAVLAGVASSRSGRDRGHGGLVQKTGHRNAVEFLRDLTGTTRDEAARAVKVGEALMDGVGASAVPATELDAGVVVDGAETDASAAATPWHEPLRAALLAGVITTAQHHAIRHGLGEPPAIDGRESDAVLEAWRAAAGELVREAAVCTVEDLGHRARSLKDMLDPAGAEERYAARFTKRSYRWSTSADGLRQAHITFDDEMAEWVRGLMDAALSPRRGGPRFVAADEKNAARALVEDPRSNEQLAYDLFVDILRAGGLASAEDVFGTKEAGVRLVTIRDGVTGDAAHRDTFGRLVATAHSEDGTLVIPGSVLERALCATGTIDLAVDGCGNPLDVGREARLFTQKQRLALAVRDGGCVWPACDRPPAYCEAHHCDPWSEGGRTDCDVGVLLCRYHHLHLHNNGWRITRAAAGGFVLHVPPGGAGDPIPLTSKSPLRWLWDPPPERARWRNAA
jgi:hypothetical protein